MTNDDAMSSTMLEIDVQDEPQRNKRNDLKHDISDIEGNIKDVEREIKRSDEEVYTYRPVTPEEANQRHRDLVFLKKDLEKKKNEFEQLDS